MAIIAGRIGNNAELKTTKNETSVASFSVACDVGWGESKKTEWVNASIFGKRADALHPYLKKGTAITVSGEAKANAWMKDGEARAEIQIIVDKVTLQGSKQGSSESQASNDVSDNSVADDIPF